jgi:hypothetical protein
MIRKAVSHTLSLRPMLANADRPLHGLALLRLESTLENALTRVKGCVYGRSYAARAGRGDLVSTGDASA